jgi:YHS domain-containing protein
MNKGVTFGLTFLFVMQVGQALAQSDVFRQNNFNISKTIALEGFDPVSYFDHAPLEGDEKFSYSYRKIKYLFATKDNLEKFKENPEKYEPVYGGWCAYAMGEKGEKVEVDPKTYKILDGKLFLFYNSWGNNTLSKWNKNESNLRKQAELNWKKFIP